MCFGLLFFDPTTVDDVLWVDLIYCNSSIVENIKSCRLHRHRTYVFPEDVDDAEMLRLGDEEQQK